MARELPTPEVHIFCDDAENPIIYRESYGIREIERRLNQVKQGGTQPDALQRLSQLIAAARREVATVCDLSDLDVISAAVDPAAARAALCAWAEAIINKSPGLLSKPAVAAPVTELVLALPDGAQVVVSSRNPSVTLGRDRTCDLCVDDARISRLHARVELGHGGFVIADVSRNGSMVLLDGTPPRELRREVAPLGTSGHIRLGLDPALPLVAFRTRASA